MNQLIFVRYAISEGILPILLGISMVILLWSPPKHFGRGKMIGSRTTYMASFEPYYDYAPSFEEHYAIPYSNYQLEMANRSGGM